MLAFYYLLNQINKKSKEEENNSNKKLKKSKLSEFSLVIFFSLMSLKSKLLIKFWSFCDSSFKMSETSVYFSLSASSLSF